MFPKITAAMITALALVASPALAQSSSIEGPGTYNNAGAAMIMAADALKELESARTEHGPGCTARPAVLERHTEALDDLMTAANNGDDTTALATIVADAHADINSADAACGAITRAEDTLENAEIAAQDAVMATGLVTFTHVTEITNPLDERIVSLESAEPQVTAEQFEERSTQVDERADAILVALKAICAQRLSADVNAACDAIKQY